MPDTHRAHVGDHQLSGRLGRTDDAGDARAGMRAGADEVQVLQHVVAVVRAEERALPQHGFEAEGAAEMGVQLDRKILGGECPHRHEIVPQAGDHRRLERVQDAIGVQLALHRPVALVLAHVRDGREDIEGAAPRRRHRRIGRGRVVEIQREIVGDDAVLVDIVEQLTVAIAEHDRVVADIGMLAL